MSLELISHVGQFPLFPSIVQHKTGEQCLDHSTAQWTISVVQCWGTALLTVLSGVLYSREKITYYTVQYKYHIIPSQLLPMACGYFGASLVFSKTT